MDVLQQRIERRGVNSASDIATRLESAEEEIRQSKSFDCQVVNQEGKLEVAVNEVIEIIYEESRRISASHR